MLSYHKNRSRNISDKFLKMYKKDPNEANLWLQKRLLKERDKIKRMVAETLQTRMRGIK